MTISILKTAALRAVTTFVYAFCASLGVNSAGIGVSLSPLHALELAGIAGLIAVAHSLPTSTTAAQPPASGSLGGVTFTATAGSTTVTPLVPRPIPAPPAPPPAPETPPPPAA